MRTACDAYVPLKLFEFEPKFKLTRQMLLSCFVFSTVAHLEIYYLESHEIARHVLR
jgi:hypothetical protein